MDRDKQYAGQGLRVGFFDQTAFQKKEQLILLLRTGVAGMDRLNLTKEEWKKIDEMPPGTELKLVRDPDNEFYEHAVKILTMDGLHIGYVTIYKNEPIARLMDAGKKLVAYTREKPTKRQAKKEREYQAPNECKRLLYNIFLVEE